MKNKTNKIFFSIILVCLLPAFLIGCQEKRPEKQAKVKQKEEKVEFKVRVAIVIDDWGYSKKLFNKTAALKTPVTFSVLPNLNYSSYIASEAHQAGYEVILHLPMESYSLVAAEEEYIKTGMSEREISDYLDKSLASVPYADGVSNHQGSKATEDKELMRHFFNILSKKDLFFLDSFVTCDSHAHEVALSKGIKSLQRAVFLDNESDFNYVKGQFEQLRKIALEKGRAVGICHARKASIEALEKLIPEAKENNIKFVFLSELLK